MIKTHSLKTLSPVNHDERSKSEKSRQVWMLSKRPFMTLRSTKKLTVPCEFNLGKSRTSNKEEKEIDLQIDI